jgi:hypothetical protein
MSGCKGLFVTCYSYILSQFFLPWFKGTVTWGWNMLRVTQLDRSSWEPGMSRLKFLCEVKPKFAVTGEFLQETLNFREHNEVIFFIS